MLGQVHQHNLQTYAHPVAAFQQTIQSPVLNQKVSNVAEQHPDVSVSQVLAHAMQTGQPVECQVTIRPFASSSESKEDAIELQGTAGVPVSINSHVALAFEVPDGVNVPHDHRIDYELRSGDVVSRGVTSNSCSVVAKNEVGAFAPGKHHTLVADMYDTDRYNEYRNMGLPIATMLMSGISTGKAPEDTFRVGALRVMSSFKLPKDRANLSLPGVPSYVGDDGWKPSELALPVGGRLPRITDVPSLKEYNNGDWVPLSSQAVGLLVNAVVMHLRWNSVPATERRMLYLWDIDRPGNFLDMLPDQVKEAVVALYGQDARLPSLRDLLSRSSGMRNAGGRMSANEAYNGLLKHLQEARASNHSSSDDDDSDGEGAAAESDGFDAIEAYRRVLERTELINEPGTQYQDEPADAELMLLVLVMLYAAQVDQSTTPAFAVFRKYVATVFDGLDVRPLYDQHRSFNNHLVLEVVDDLPGWMGGTGLAVRKRDLIKLLAPLYEQNDAGQFVQWLTSMLDVRVPMRLGDGTDTANGQRVLGMWGFARILPPEAALPVPFYFVRVTDSRDVWVYGVPSQAPQGAWMGATKNLSATLDEISTRLNGPHNYQENSTAAAASSSGGTSSSYSGSFGFDSAETVNDQFAPYFHKALNVNDAMMARPTDKTHVSGGVNVRSIDELVNQPLVAAMLRPGATQPDTMLIRADDNANTTPLYKVYHNDRMVGTAVYDPVINQYRFSDASAKGTITDHFHVDDHGVSWGNNYYANDMNKAFPQRTQIQSIMDDMSKAYTARNTSTTLAEQVLAAQEQANNSQDTLPWQDLHDISGPAVLVEPEAQKVGAHASVAVPLAFAAGTALGAGGLYPQPYYYGPNYYYDPYYYGPGYGWGRRRRRWRRRRRRRGYW